MCISVASLTSSIDMTRLSLRFVRLLVVLACLTLTSECVASRPINTPTPTLAPGEPGPDSISCDKPVIVKATVDPEGVREERQWLQEHYPGRGPYAQSLRRAKGRAFDVLTFTTKDGRAVSVCFDITASFGHY